MLVKKKNGGMWFCTDYYCLHRVTKQGFYPLSHNDDHAWVAGSNWFSSLDLHSWHYREKEKTVSDVL